MNLFEQLSAAAAAAKALKQPDARFFACNNNGIVSAYPLPAAAFMARRRSVTYPLIPLTQG